MSRKLMIGAALAALTLAAGCVGGGSTSSRTATGPGPLTPAPVASVTANRLPPPPPPPPPVEAPAPAPGAQVAALPPGSAATPPAPPASSAPVTRESVTGAWKVSAGGGNCQIFMALTQWTGGYKAASRGCPGQVADVTAWDVSGSQVVLKDGSGNSVASLSASGSGGYQGTTAGGQAISIYR